MEPNQSSLEFFRQVFGGSWITQGIWVAAELAIADVLAEGPQTAEQLAHQTNTHPGSLYRVLRALASVGIFHQDSEGRFTQTPLSEMLQSNGNGSQRSFAIMMGAEFYQAWGELLHSVRTGNPGFEKRFGASAFEHFMANPQRHSIYDRAMGGFGTAEIGPVLDAYDFSTFTTVADVGGGSGLLLSAILERHPGVKGMLFDLPPVAERARALMATSSLAERYRIEGGDFFSSIPIGADAYVLQHIIHDWEDPEATVILQNCRKVLKPTGKVLLIEMVIPQGNQPGFGKWLDLMMLLIGGRERTEEDYTRLFSAAGLKLQRVIPTANEASIIEAVPAS